jgi:hypothetical protein
MTGPAWLQALESGAGGLFYQKGCHNQSSPLPALDCEHIMNYVHDLFLWSGEWEIMVRALVEEAATLASLALFLGMIAIWAQVIATL